MGLLGELIRVLGDGSERQDVVAPHDHHRRDLRPVAADLRRHGGVDRLDQRRACRHVARVGIECGAGRLHGLVGVDRDHGAVHRHDAGAVQALERRAHGCLTCCPPRVAETLGVHHVDRVRGIRHGIARADVAWIDRLRGLPGGADRTGGLVDVLHAQRIERRTRQTVAAGHVQREPLAGRGVHARGLDVGRPATRHGGLVQQHTAGDRGAGIRPRIRGRSLGRDRLLRRPGARGIAQVRHPQVGGTRRGLVQRDRDLPVGRVRRHDEALACRGGRDLPVVDLRRGAHDRLAVVVQLLVGRRQPAVVDRALVQHVLIVGAVVGEIPREGLFVARRKAPRDQFAGGLAVDRARRDLVIRVDLHRDAGGDVAQSVGGRLTDVRRGHDGNSTVGLEGSRAERGVPRAGAGRAGDRGYRLRERGGLPGARVEREAVPGLAIAVAPVLALGGGDGRRLGGVESRGRDLLPRVAGAVEQRREEVAEGDGCRHHRRQVGGGRPRLHAGEVVPDRAGDLAREDAGRIRQRRHRQRADDRSCQLEADVAVGRHDRKRIQHRLVDRKAVQRHGVDAGAPDIHPRVVQFGELGVGCDGERHALHVDDRLPPGRDPA